MSAGRPGNERRDAALRYAHAGWPVFPALPGQKIPATRHGLLDATTDPDKIGRWWDRNPARNVAIATGTPGPDVVDVDNHGARGSGFAAWNEMRRAGLVARPRAIVGTPSGGFHAYFVGTGQASGKIPARHVDFRGRGGYVIAPPSTVGGKPYLVVSHEPSGGTVDWAAARRLLAPEPQRRPQRGRDRSPAAPRDLSLLAGWVSRLPEGNRNDGLFWAANRVIEAGRGDALDSLARGAKDAGLDEREIARTIASAQRGQRPFAREADREAG